MVARGGGFPGSSNPILLIAIVLLVYSFISGTLHPPILDVLRRPTSADAWLDFGSFAFAIFLGITVHEFMHAYVAHQQGDDTGRLFGRLSLNPFAHFDLFGSLLIVIGGFGYGKPVPVNEARLHGGALGMSAVALAGPLANFALATVFAIPLHFGGALPQAYEYFLTQVVFYNCLLGVFNLIPIPPLDGSNVVYGLLPWGARQSWRTFQQYGPLLLMLIFMVGFRFLNALVFGPAIFLTRLLIGA